jgi:arachidonate 15-lipoxygenase
MAAQLSLPQQDQTGQEERTAYLERMKQEYAYTLTYNGNIATTNLPLPKQEKPPFSYTVALIANLVKLATSVPNIIAAKFRAYPYQDFKDYFFFKPSTYPDQEFLADWQNDRYLGLQRVIGINPVVIQGLNRGNALPATFAAQDLVEKFTPQTYEVALAEGRLYITDYSVLKAVANNLGEEAGYKKYVTAPIALYYRQDDGLLAPLGIQLNATQPTSDDNPIYTPDAGNDWLMARSYVQAADGTHHELWTHATRIHYLMESIILGSRRNLAPQHPLFPLLDPHLQLTLNVNSKPLFQPDKDGTIPMFGKMFACDNPTLVAFMGQGMREYDFQKMAFPNDIKNRHMEDPQLYYPYRDDGQLIWDAIQEFVGNYVRFYYKSDQDLVHDTELQAWGQNIGGNRQDNNCGINGFPTDFRTIDQVIETVVNIIFIATGHHNCVHFAQYKYAGFLPNMPFSIYAPPSKDLPEVDVLKLFPPYNIGFYQTGIFYLTNFRVNRMGDYDLTTFEDGATDLVKAYQTKLKEISQEVQKRNKNRVPYSLMDPATIPNSVTI